MSAFTIKRLTVEDVDELQLISRRTFYETFWMSNTHSDMVDYLENQLSKERLASEIQTRGSEFYFVVANGVLDENSKPLGYLKINHGEAQTENRNENSLEIERIYVLSLFQGLHLGRLLFHHALNIAEKLNADFVWLGVWEKNYRAIDFYKQNGFVEYGQHEFRLGSDIQTDILMKRITGVGGTNLHRIE